MSIRIATVQQKIVDERCIPSEGYCLNVARCHSHTMSTEKLPDLPSASDALSNWLGFKLPAIPLPQTVRNVDKAVARLVGTGADYVAAKIEGKTHQTNARVRAEIEMIQAASRLAIESLPSDPDLAKRAIEFTLRNSVLRQRNKEQVSRLAIEHITQHKNHETTDAQSEIDDDWLNNFEEIVSKKSNADIQTLWSRILSGEIRRPGSFSLRSLNILANIDHNEAQIIHTILSRTINDKFIFNQNGTENIGDALDGEYLGIISSGGGLLKTSFTVQNETNFSVGDVVIKAQFGTQTTLNLRVFPLTRFGKELYSLMDSCKAEQEYIDAFVSYLKTKGARISRASLLKRLGDGQVLHSDFVMHPE